MTKKQMSQKLAAKHAAAGAMRTDDAMIKEYMRLPKEQLEKVFAKHFPQAD